MKKWRRRIKHFLVPHKGNRYKPGLLAKESIAAVALILLLAQGLYLIQSKIVLENSGFLAAVLPAALTELTNRDRASAGLDTLIVDPLLAAAAQAKAEDMAQKGYFAHTSPEGKSLRDWLDGVGYSYSYAGENLAVDFTESADVEKAWMNSPTHRANVLKAEYTRVGFGVAEGVYQGRRVTFVAQYFAARPGDDREADAVADPVAAPPIASTNQTPTRVLGDEAEPIRQSSEVHITNTTEAASVPEIEERQIVPTPGDAAVLSTSPSKMITYIIVGITAFIALFFSIAVLVNVRLRLVQMEMISSGVVFAGLVACLLIYNFSGSAPVTVPTETQAASVSALF